MHVPMRSENQRCDYIPLQAYHLPIPSCPAVLILLAPASLVIYRPAFAFSSLSLSLSLATFRFAFLHRTFFGKMKNTVRTRGCMYARIMISISFRYFIFEISWYFRFYMCIRECEREYPDESDDALLYGNETLKYAFSVVFGSGCKGLCY